MAHYTKNQSITIESDPVYEDIYLSSETRNKRNQLKGLMDEFCTFKWRGIDAFEVFGAFVINSRNLKFYNGPTYSNQYTKPQFESAAGNLTGVTFNVQQIDFTIGVYWISEDHYRRLIYWLHPYEINTLTFGFEPEYYYQVKLAKVNNSTRTIVGYENKEPMYYTEIQLTFEIQGPNCAYYINKYEFNAQDGVLPGQENLIFWKINSQSEGPDKSDLAMPLKWYLHINPSNLVPNISSEAWKDATLHLAGYANYTDSGQKIRLFETDLKNLVFSDSSNNVLDGFDIIYDSENSLLFLNHGDSQNFLLSRLLTSSTGKRIVNELTSQQFSVAGRFEDYNINPRNYLQFELEVICMVSVNGSTEIISNCRAIVDKDLSSIEMRARTNLI